MPLAPDPLPPGAPLGKLPPEVLQFFHNPGGHSLLIRGPAGTGKTTLTLQLLETLYGFERNFYLSSRVSDRTLLTQFPWLLPTERTERAAPRGDAGLLRLPLAHGRLQLGHARD